jgi:hypothetical protein
MNYIESILSIRQEEELHHANNKSAAHPLSFLVIYENFSSWWLRGKVNSSSFVWGVHRLSKFSVCIRVDNLLDPEFWMEVSVNLNTRHASAKGRLPFCVSDASNFVPIKKKHVMFEESLDRYSGKVSCGEYSKSDWCFLSGKKDFLLFDTGAQNTGADLAHTNVQYNRAAVIDTVEVKQLPDGLVVEVRHSECPNDFFFKLELTGAQLYEAMHDSEED